MWQSIRISSIEVSINSIGYLINSFNSSLLLPAILRYNFVPANIWFILSCSSSPRWFRSFSCPISIALVIFFCSSIFAFNLSCSILRISEISVCITTAPAFSAPCSGVTIIRNHLFIWGESQGYSYTNSFSLFLRTAFIPRATFLPSPSSSPKASLAIST